MGDSTYEDKVLTGQGKVDLQLSGFEPRHDDSENFDEPGDKQGENEAYPVSELLASLGVEEVTDGFEEVVD